ncbi:DsbA-like protein [Aeromicrobium marinum DSM 15272]|uniref:DsbA-like protein n=1 Tax=Aeromicrobium marinum DSM 15272 TaxID=585531 RepID=E2S9K9_9ACTN|nr:DsbA-like protein [Aeromicrobium marinum DSM 15272]
MVGDDVDTPVRVQVWSDVACPWCFVGKRRFEAAVARFDGQVEVEYRSFELSPETPVDFDGSSVDFLVRHKRMPPEQVRSMLADMTRVAADEGLAFDFDTVRHTNTRRAHELLHLASRAGLQVAMKERLLAAYFEEGRHVGRIDDLADLAAEVGLDRDDVVAALTSGRHAADVTADIEQAHEYGISGVPFHVVDGRFAVSGAQSPETFLAVLQRARDEVPA